MGCGGYELGSFRSNKHEYQLFAVRSCRSGDQSILNEHESDTTKLGAVIRIKNTTDKITRVPDFELRVRMEDGIEYTLQPSAKNPKSILPKTQQELSYLTNAERSDDADLSELSFVDVDMEVYPKRKQRC